MIARFDDDIASLLDRVWPGLRAAIALGERLGFAWSDISTPFVRRERGRVVAHVGVIALDLMIEGRRRTVGAVHAVCTDPEARGRGLARAVMEEVLHHAAGRWETLVLTTTIPAFYEAFGFRAIGEHRFACEVAPRRPRGVPARPLDVAAADDVRRLRWLLRERAPVSSRLGVLERGEVFVLAELLARGDFSGARYLADLDAVVACVVQGDTLVLHDVVARELPPLDALRERVAPAARRVVAFFTPDRLDAPFVAEPYDRARAVAEGRDWFVGLMARGPLAIAGGPFMMPFAARC